MVFTIYTRADGAYLLVPECMKASREAEALHGPLTACARIESDEHPLPAVWGHVMAEVDNHSFAVIQETVGHQLLGIRCDKET